MRSKPEDIFCKDLASLLEADLDLSSLPVLLQGLQVRTHQKVLYDVTVLYGGDGQFRPKLGFLEQDIVIGKPLAVPDALGACFSRAENRSELFQPEVVIEVKCGNVTTHQLITYSHIAGRMKSVFPRCRYYLVLGYCSVKAFEKVMRHGTNFDRVISLCARRIKQPAYSPYTAGRLKQDMIEVKGNRSIYDDLVYQLKNDLSSIKINW
jgi:hypothetical protein